jgi:4-amino-4-deoxychorismate lyase
MPRSELNGGPATADDLGALALLNYGHFTSMQVRNACARGLDLHLLRLEQATRALFSRELAIDRVRDDMRGMVAREGADGSLRVTVFSRRLDRDRPADAVAPDVLVTLSPPREIARTPLRLKSFRYERAMPQIKHVGTFGLFHHRRLAQLDGFDDALFVDASDAVSEASVWNIGFFDGDAIVWPDAPALAGISMQLIGRGLVGKGIRSSSRRIARRDLSSYRSAFLTHSSCAVRPVSSIDGVDFVVDAELIGLLDECYAANPWQAI